MVATQTGVHRVVRLADGSRVELDVSQYGPCLRVDGFGWHALAELDWGSLNHLLAVFTEAKEAARANGWQETVVKGRRSFLEVDR